MNTQSKISNHIRNRAVGESCTIKGLILTFEASPCFIIPLIIKMNSSSIKVHAILEFGASACFINKDFVDY